MKKIIYIIMLCIIAMSLVGCSNKEEKNSEINQYTEVDNKVSEDNKSLVLYFSATNTTKTVAQKIASVSNSDIIEIVPKDIYTSDDLDYNNDNSRANKEQNDNSSRPEIENSMDLLQYDTIYLGYPIWWGTIPKIILTLLDTYNLEGKTVIPFCTSGGSSITQSQNDLESYNKNINWLKGKRFSSNVTETELTNWIKELNV